MQSEETRDLAIVLRAVPYEDRHRVVTAITERHGRVSALARNAVQSRRFGGCLDLFVASEWRWVDRPGADLARLEEAVIRRPFVSIRRDVGRLAMASAWSEILMKVAPERQAAPELFRLHANALAALDDALEGPRALLERYLLKILQASGAQPNLGACLSCAAPGAGLDPAESLACLVADAGWICPTCRQSTTRHLRASDGTAMGERLPTRLTARAVSRLIEALSGPMRRGRTDPAGAVELGDSRDNEPTTDFLLALMEFHLPGFDRRQIRSFSFVPGLEPREPSPRSLPDLPR